MVPTVPELISFQILFTTNELAYVCGILYIGITHYASLCERPCSLIPKY